MGAHAALHEAREVGATIAQSTDNEVGTLLSRPTEVDRPTICQLGRDEKSLLVSLQCSSPHFGADAMPATLGIVDPQVLFSVYPKARMTFIPQRYGTSHC